MEKLIGAVVGCGRMGAFTSESVLKYSPDCWLPLSHADALQSLDNVELRAICDMNEPLLEKAAKNYLGVEKFTDYSKLLDDVKPDILCIATRTKGRFEIIKAGISSGVKAFHLEKPLCNSLEELNELENLSLKNDCAFTYGTIRRYFAIYKKAKDMVESGRFGDLQQIQVNFGSSALFWTHAHSVDIILFFAGNRKLHKVQAHLDNVVTLDNGATIESDPTIISAGVLFDDGLTGFISRASGMDVILSCSKGEVIVESDGRGIVCRESSEQEPYYSYPAKYQKLESTFPEGTYSAVSLLASSNIFKNNSSLDSRHIFLGQRILFGFMHSHQMNGQLISLDEIEQELCILARSGDYYA